MNQTSRIRDVNLLEVEDLVNRQSYVKIKQHLEQHKVVKYSLATGSNLLSSSLAKFQLTRQERENILARSVRCILAASQTNNYQVPNSWDCIEATQISTFTVRMLVMVKYYHLHLMEIFRQHLQLRKCPDFQSQPTSAWTALKIILLIQAVEQPIQPNRKKHKRQRIWWNLKQHRIIPWP